MGSVPFAKVTILIEPLDGKGLKRLIKIPKATIDQFNAKPADKQEPWEWLENTRVHFINEYAVELDMTAYFDPAAGNVIQELQGSAIPERNGEVWVG